MAYLFHENKVFEDQTVYLSGNSYFDCEFRRCVFIFRGDYGPLSNCKFDSCIWHLDFLVHDHKIWSEFLGGLGKKIAEGLPRGLQGRELPPPAEEDEDGG